MIPNSKGTGKVSRLRMAANAVFAPGDMVMENATGYAAEVAALLNNRGIAGIALEAKDNTGGADGDLDVLVMWDIEVLMAATSIAQANVGAVVYGVDANTVDETDTGNLPIAGVLNDFVSSTSGWVHIDRGLNKAL